MFPLFETVCVKDGHIQHKEWHQKRYESSLKQYYNSSSFTNLFEEITIPDCLRLGLTKLRIKYNDINREMSFEPYEVQDIQTLKIVIDNELDYSLKYTNRDRINSLYEQKGKYDDILIIKNNEVTDSSYTNIAFFDGNTWFTPSTPLLQGIARERLLHEGIIEERIILKDDIYKYQSFKLINAMRDFEALDEIEISGIK